MAKRPHDRNPSEPNGRGKSQKTASGSKQNQSVVPPGGVIFRLVCHNSKFGSIIGKGGGIVANIRQETGAKIKIEEIFPGCEDRVVVITGSDKEAGASKKPSKEENKESSVATDGDGGGDGGGDGDGDVNDDGDGDVDGDEEKKAVTENNEEKGESSALEASELEKPLSSAQKALLLVYGRLLEGEDEIVDDEGRKSSSFSVRLLVFPSQGGRLRAKGGNTIKQMSSDSGARIFVLPKDQLPLCALPTDEVVQIGGGVDSVKKALQLVTQLLIDNPPRERELLSVGSRSGPPSHPFASFSRADVIPPVTFLPQGLPFPGKPFGSVDYFSNTPFSKFNEGFAADPVHLSPEPITYRLLCSNDKAGSVIGKGGTVIKGIQRETGCEIKVHATNEPDDRVILISGPELPSDRISAAQDALLRVHERIAMPAPDFKENMVSTRLIVPSNQTSCLRGKGGSIISEMRKLTGAQIRIISNDLPRSVREDDELVLVTGEFRTVQDALLEITSRLRHHTFRGMNVPPMNHTAYPLDQMPPFGPYVGRRPSPPRMYPNLPPLFQNDSVGRPHEDRPFPHTPGGPHFERMPPAPWASQDIREGGGSMPVPDFGIAGPQRRIDGFPGGNQPTVTVDVVVPRALVPSIYGEDGFCLRRIREISEAKITITEPRPEATETVIIISGIPEQTHAAQSLLQAFVLSETSAA